MPLFTTFSRTFARQAPTFMARRSHTLAQQTPTLPSQWLSRWVTPPKRPMTAGEYTFVLAGKTVLGVGALGLYLTPPYYLLVKQPIPERMLKVMSELPPADAERLWKSEMETVHPPIRYH